MESAAVEPGPGQNLNDLQNYLVHFSKEIETATQPTSDQLQEITLIQPAIENSEADAGQVELVTSKSETSSSSQFSSGFYSEQTVMHVATSLGASVQELSGMTHSISVAESQDVGNTHTINTEADQIENESKQQEESTDALENYHDYIASLTGEKIDGEELTVEPVTLAQELAVTSMMEGLVSHTSAGKMIRIVTVGKDGQMQLVGEDMPAGITISNLELKQEPPSELDGIGGIDLKQSHIIDGTDPVAVLASVASNTSSLSQIQNSCRSDINDAQLVALQNSADSSQPQLVAVHGGVSDAMQVIGGTDVITGQTNQVMLNTGNAFQTVTIVPSEVNQESGVVSYVLIVSPDGDKEGGEKHIALDMAGYDLKDEALREVTEEIIQEDGTTHRVLKITPQNYFPGSQTQLMCNICNYTSPKRYLLSRHMKTHSEDRPYKCNICERGFKTLASLTNHVNTHTGTRPHKCKDCESSFTTSGELVRHVRYRHTFEKPHKCPECDYASVELSKLKRHIRMHTGERPYRCQHCSYASPDTYKLKRHLRIHTGEKPYECDQCHARFTQSNSLKAHKLIHSGDKPVFQCDLCPTTCGRKTDLKIHYQKLHTSEHPLMCRKCGQNFPDRYTYKLHLKQHEGEKCFKCDECDYAALSQRHLESHMLVHSGEKPFECGGCDQTFRQKQLLRRHRNLHHTPDYIKPTSKTKCYNCTECDKTFAHRGYLARHLETHHGKHVTFSESEDETEVLELPTISAQHILESNLMQEWRDGKLGNSPQVVIVHPDGRVEEVTPKLQAPPDRTVDDLLDAMSAHTEVNQGSVTKYQKSGDMQDQGVVSVTETSLHRGYKGVAEQRSKQASDVAPEGVDPDPSAAVYQSNQESVSLVKHTHDVIGEAMLSLTSECQMKEAGTQATIDSDSEDETFQPIIVSCRTINSSEKKTKLMTIDKSAGSNTDQRRTTELIKMRTVNPKDIQEHLRSSSGTAVSFTNAMKSATITSSDQTFKLGTISTSDCLGPVSDVTAVCPDTAVVASKVVSDVTTMFPDTVIAASKTVCDVTAVCPDNAIVASKTVSDVIGLCPDNAIVASKTVSDVTGVSPDTVIAASKTASSASNVKTTVVSKKASSSHVDSNIGSGPVYPVPNTNTQLDSDSTESASMNSDRQESQCLDASTGEFIDMSINMDPLCEISNPAVLCSRSDITAAPVVLIKQEISSVMMPSPDRLTRSMKRKEIEMEASPAKRTRRATADSK